MTADQRADTPRTAAGRDLALLYRRLDPLTQDELERRILAIEAEAYDEGWRADIGSNGPKAAAEPAAAEPPDHHCCSGCDADGHCTHGLPAAWYAGYDRGVRNTVEVERAAQPPRGSLPDRHHFDADPFEPQYCKHCDVSLSEHITAMSMPAKRGGSLTATEPHTHDLRIGAREYGDGKNVTAWQVYCTICDQAGRLAVPTPFQDGSPRGVTPALDVERLARALCLTLHASYPHSYDDACGQSHGRAQSIAAEYARLGSPEDSDATSR